EANKFYARSAAVVHYLNADPNRRQQLYKYLALTKQGFSVDEAFSSVFKMSYSELDKAVNAYISGRHVMGRTFPITKGGVEFPAVNFTVAKIDQRKSLEHLVTKLTMLPPESL